MTTLPNTLWHTCLQWNCKTIATFLWQGHISILWEPAKLLSSQEANFESKIITELCELMSIWKVRNSPYHAQTNRQVEQAHQMLMHMIVKLSKGWKADWPKHLPELVHAYNSTRSAIIGYIPHYLMFGHHPHLPINFYFPMIRGTKTPMCWPLCHWSMWMATGSL